METCGCDFEQSSLKNLLSLLATFGTLGTEKLSEIWNLYVLVLVGIPVSLHVNVTVFIPI